MLGDKSHFQTVQESDDVIGGSSHPGPPKRPEGWSQYLMPEPSGTTGGPGQLFPTRNLSDSLLPSGRDADVKTDLLKRKVCGMTVFTYDGALLAPGWGLAQASCSAGSMNSAEF